MEITRASLEQTHPDLVAAIRQEGFDEGSSQGAIEGATQERQRIMGIYGLKATGKIATLRDEMMNDPGVSVGDAAVRILNARGESDEQKRQAMLDARDEDEAELAPVGGNGPDEEMSEQAREDAAVNDIVKQTRTLQSAANDPIAGLYAPE